MRDDHQAQVRILDAQREAAAALASDRQKLLDDERSMLVHERAHRRDLEEQLEESRRDLHRTTVKLLQAGVRAARLNEKLRELRELLDDGVAYDEDLS